jgi:hypothetical protein
MWITPGFALVCHPILQPVETYYTPVDSLSQGSNPVDKLGII